MERTVLELYTEAKQTRSDTGEVQRRYDLDAYRRRIHWSVTDTERRPKPPRELEWKDATARVYETRNLYSGNIQYAVGPFIVDTPTCSVVDYDPILMTGDKLQNLDGKLRLKISQLKFSLGQDLYEWRQTTNLFLPLARDVIQTMRALRKAAGQVTWGLLVGAKSITAFKQLYKTGGSRLRWVADKWLAYQFGARPLLEDLYAATEVLAVRSTEDWTRKVKQGGYAAYADRRLVPIRDFGAEYGVWVDRTLRVYQRVGIQYRMVADPLVRDLNAFGITNPALTLWELTPWSFVVDQIIPVGKYLEAADALCGIRDWSIHDGFKYDQTVKIDVGDPPTTLRGTGTCRYAPRITLDDFQMKYKAHRDVSSLLSVVNDLALLVQLRQK